MWLECRLYGLLFFTLFAIALLDWVRYQGFLGACRAPTMPQVPLHYKVLTVEELCTCLRTVHERLNSTCTRMRSLRENQPAVVHGGYLGSEKHGVNKFVLAVLFDNLWMLFAVDADWESCIRCQHHLRLASNNFYNTCVMRATS